MFSAVAIGIYLKENVCDRLLWRKYVRNVCEWGTVKV